jgi:hypothetical protein
MLRFGALIYTFLASLTLLVVGCGQNNLATKGDIERNVPMDGASICRVSTFAISPSSPRFITKRFKVDGNELDSMKIHLTAAQVSTHLGKTDSDSATTISVYVNSRTCEEIKGSYDGRSYDCVGVSLSNLANLACNKINRPNSSELLNYDVEYSIFDGNLVSGSCFSPCN